MKIGLCFLTFLLAALLGMAEAAVPALPTERPPSAPALMPLEQPLPPGPGPGVVPGVRLESEDKSGRTYAEGNPFIIWGGSRSQRSNLFTAAGLVRRAVLDALHLPDTWTNHILIQVKEALAAGSESRPSVWTVISQVEGGFRIEINLAPSRNSVPGSLLRENLVRAILADGVLKGKESLDLSGAPTPPPDWLLHGTLALMDYRELGRQSETFSRIFQLGRVLSVPDILNADPSGMDSLSMAIYRVSCGGLLMMLVEQPRGPEQLVKLLPGLAHAGTDHATLIERAYPNLGGSTNSLSKWWSLQIATLSQPGMEEVRKPSETEQLLVEALTLQFTPPAPQEKKSKALARWLSRPTSVTQPTGILPIPRSAPVLETCGISDYSRVLALPEPAPIFNQAALALTRLMLRAHPVYRPIILEYQEALRQLAKGKVPKALPSTLARLTSTRQRLGTTLQGIEDHLDWYEATQSTSPSGAFEDYLKAADDIGKPLDPRGDALSRYLDQVDREFTR